MMDHLLHKADLETEINIVGEMYWQIDDLFHCHGHCEVDDLLYWENKYPKWMVNTQKVITYLKFYDIPDIVSTVDGEEPTDFDKGLIFEFTDLYHGLYLQLLMLEVGYA